MEKKSIFSKSFREYRKHSIPPLVELLMTEEKYVELMGHVVNGYIAEYLDKTSSIPVPESLKGVKGLIFGNIEEIYDWHQNYFLKALIQHQNSLSELGKLFTQNEHQFHMYSKYCNNSEISNYLVTIHAKYFDNVKKKLGHKLGINDLLITPVQRLPRYPLLLSDILKHLKKQKLKEHIESMTAALSMIQTVCNRVDEYTALQGIRDFDRQISEQGKLLLHGHLTCVYDGKKRNQYVFLFQKIIIFTTKEEAKSKYLNPTYKFHSYMPMNELQMKDLENNRFLLKLTGPNYLDLNIICCAGNIEMHQQWLKAITNQLSKQQNFIYCLANPPNNEDENEILL